MKKAIGVVLIFSLLPLLLRCSAYPQNDIQSRADPMPEQALLAEQTVQP